MATAWSELRAARVTLAEAREHAAEAVRRRGELEYLVERVDAAEVAPGERALITVERERLRHLDELAAAIAGAIALLAPDDGDGAQTVIAQRLAAGGRGGAVRAEPRRNLGRAARRRAAAAGGHRRAAQPHR